ncbi:MAG: two-component system response regulator, partial [Deltaproteobacteria bacterium]|nr:two-component system response regulator [Deltaproteobacteria bacterium]
FLTRKSGSADTELSLEESVRREIEKLLDIPGETADAYHRIQARVERPLLESVLERTQGNQIRAAAILGINRNTLRKKITELGIELPQRG